MTKMVINFSTQDSDVYSDETVRLVDELNGSLIQRLHDAFSRFQKTLGVIREAEERLNDTLYEDDYQRANACLMKKSWDTLDLNTAAFLIGFHGCLGTNEILALLPFLFEILLRAESWVWPFELVISHLQRTPEASWDYQTAYDDPVLRRLVLAALQAAEMKYVNDSEFRDSEAQALLGRVIQDWA